MTDSSKSADATLFVQGPEGEWQRIVFELKAYRGKDADPTHRVSLLDSAQKEVVSISSTATVEEAFTLMLNHNYSQLPVLEGDSVRGIFSWRSYGKQVTRGRDCKIVSQAMEPAATIDLTESIFEAFAAVTKNEYVLVRNHKHAICGIVTTFDVSELFAKLAEPFLLVEEIEKRVRSLLRDHVTTDELEAANDRRNSKDRALSLSDLSFGAYVRLCERKEVWERLKVRLDQGRFVSLLDNVREIRNEVMHFRPKGIAASKLVDLRNFTKLLRDISPIGED